MENNIDFKDLWSRQSAPAPDTNDLQKRIEKLKAGELKKIILANVTLTLTAAFIIAIWFFFSPKFITTRIGIILIITAIAFFLIARNRTIPLYKKGSSAMSNSEYLENLIAIKNAEQFLQTKVLNIYFCLLSSGLALYMYEYASKMSGAAAIAAYGITAAWIALAWFVLRPKQIRKCQKRITPVIEQLQDIKNDLAG
jgi:membrane protein YdbS with pleckstrin-like domain